MQALFDASFLPADLSPWVANLVMLSAKGMLILFVTWGMAYALKGSAAAIRYMVWCTGLLSLMALPVLSTVLPSWQLDVIPEIAQAPPSALDAPVPVWDDEVVASTAPPSYQSVAPVAPAPLPSNTQTDAVESTAAPTTASSSSFTSFFAGLDFHWTTWAIIVWLIGVFVAGVRLLLAHAGATLLVRKSEMVEDEDWHLMSERICRRLGIDRFVRLRKSGWITVPMSVGILRPAVVLPEEMNTWTEDERRTVLYHELAHVKRKDCLLQLLTQVTCALHWFNPMVWVAAWQLRIERERACDDLVLTAGVEASSYAQTLLHTARKIKKAEWSTLATVSMARKSQLEGRLLSILDPERRRSLNRATSILTIGMIAAIVVPLAIMQPARAQQAPVPPPMVVPPVAAFPDVYVPEIYVPEIVVPEINVPEIYVPEINVGDIYVPEIVVPEIAVPEIVIPDFVVPDVDVDVADFPNPVITPVPNPIAVIRDANGYDLGDTPMDSLSIDQIIKLRKYGVDADFIRDLKALGFSSVTYNELIQLSKYGAHPRYIKSMRDAGYDGLEMMDYAQMSKYGVNPRMVSALAEAGYGNLDAEDLVRMSKYGVNNNLIETLEQYGFDDVSIDELVAAAKYGVDRGLIEGIAEAGLDGFSVEDLVQMSKYGVNKSHIEMLRSYGYNDLSQDELVSASKYGVRESLIEGLIAAGYNDLSISEIVQLSKYGVSDDLIKSLRSYGYDNLSAGELVSAAKYGVRPSVLASMKELGFDGISLDEVIRMSKYGVNARYISEMEGVGLDLDVDDLIRLRKYGVDADYVKEMKPLVKDLTVDRLIEMHNHGVDADYIRSLRDN